MMYCWHARMAGNLKPDQVRMTSIWVNSYIFSNVAYIDVNTIFSHNNIYSIWQYSPSSLKYCDFLTQFSWHNFFLKNRDEVRKAIENRKKYDSFFWKLRLHSKVQLVGLKEIIRMLVYPLLEK
jgi:hypothetical protein